MIRRSITVNDDLNNYINGFRAWLLVRKKEHDFTTIINMLAQLGAYRLSHAKGELTKAEKRIINKYLEGISELQIEGATDEAWTRWFQIQFPIESGVQVKEKKSKRDKVKEKKKNHGNSTEGREEV